MEEDQWRIAAYDPEWRDMFLEMGTQLRKFLGEIAVRIDHVGSTSIIGIDAKPIVDIQISVVDFDSDDLYRHKIVDVWRQSCNLPDKRNSNPSSCSVVRRFHGFSPNPLPSVYIEALHLVPCQKYAAAALRGTPRSSFCDPGSQ